SASSSNSRSRDERSLFWGSVCCWSAPDLVGVGLGSRRSQAGVRFFSCSPSRRACIVVGALLLVFALTAAVLGAVFGLRPAGVRERGAVGELLVELGLFGLACLVAVPRRSRRRGFGRLG